MLSEKEVKFRYRAIVRAQEANKENIDHPYTGYLKGLGEALRIVLDLPEQPRYVSSDKEGLQ